MDSEAEQIGAKISTLRVPVEAQWVKNPTSVRKDVGSIPGLTQWVKVPALLQAADAAWIPHCCGCGVGWQLQLHLDPSLGTPICLGCSPRKKKKGG